MGLLETYITLLLDIPKSIEWSQPGVTEVNILIAETGSLQKKMIGYQTGYQMVGIKMIVCYILIVIRFVCTPSGAQMLRQARSQTRF